MQESFFFVSFFSLDTFHNAGKLFCALAGERQRQSSGGEGGERRGGGERDRESPGHGEKRRFKKRQAK
jgi:hypothetical protein